MESILNSIKKLLGIMEDDEHFDQDIIIHINSAFMILNQLGVGPEEVFTIQDASDSWTDFIHGSQNIESVRTYVYLKVKLVFDPPQSSVVSEAYNKTLSELEWRLNIASDKPNA